MDHDKEIELIVNHFRSRKSFSMKEVAKLLSNNAFSIPPQELPEFLQEMNALGFICTNGEFYRRK